MFTEINVKETDQQDADKVNQKLAFQRQGYSCRNERLVNYKENEEEADKNNNDER